MSEEHVSMLRRFYGDVTTNFDLLPFDPQVEWVEPDVPDLWFSGTHYGLDAVRREIIDPTPEKIEGLSFELDQLIDAGEYLIATGVCHGREKTIGTELKAPFCHIWTLRDGKIVRFRSYTDTAKWLQALNLLHLMEHPVGV